MTFASCRGLYKAEGTPPSWWSDPPAGGAGGPEGGAPTGALSLLPAVTSFLFSVTYICAVLQKQEHGGLVKTSPMG